MTLAPTPATQLPFSFMVLVQKTGKLAKTSRSRTIDPLTAARNKILAAIDQQEAFVRDLMDGKPLPKKEGGKTVAVWFSKQNDGYWTSVRYGQLSIPLNEKEETDMLIGDLKSLHSFYGALKIAIGKGELDGPIGKLQQERSAALAKGKTGTQPAPAKAA